ncbi:sigma-54-dependent transcriptional regulator [Natranaerofaba carboxydovora]|uniref:sigma-54-dependent transcriptional regulator n=1 Tax=Natranaerofaba carboxydovora TaxID=2742683 RepID=UPI001F140F5E|nr:sigma-54 dependent transcriptional regulator [Natranaerofaba carboxydovora]UMZ74189.1 Transcriptional regulatory protein ZraR [Natranaerofaba carboxydovora]
MSGVLVVDDEKDIGEFFKYFLRKLKIEASTALDMGSARGLLKENKYDLVILDLKLPDGNGIDLLEEITENSPETNVIIITGVSTIRTAVEAIKKGAYDYIEKPFEDLNDLEEVITNALSSGDGPAKDSKESKKLREDIGFVVGYSQKMQQILSVVEKIAAKKINILVTGETGTGKEVLARYIHGLSDRAYNPFVPVNCGAFAETLLESQLFGHEKGAFTDAYTSKKGVFEIANNGTLFLDEIGEASKNVQVKLLRVLDSGKFNRVGSEKLINTNCRIIAATNVDLEKAVEMEKFRKDLYYRLNVVNIEIPPLRDRKEDIPILAEYIAEKKSNKKIKFTSDTVSKLKNYSWPGNIRELSNVLSRALALSSNDNVIKEEYLMIKETGEKTDEETEETNEENIDDMDNSTKELEEKLNSWFENNYLDKNTIDLNKIKEQITIAENNFMKNIVTQTLKETIGDRKKAANKLNITPRKLRYLLKEK